MIRKYGSLPSKPDARDFLFMARLAPAVLPPAVDLRPWCSAVKDQGELGSCTGQAGAGLREFYQIKRQQTFVPLSPLFLYWSERMLEGNPAVDVGAEPRDAMRVLLHTGVAPETDFPYDVHAFAQQPTRKATHDAAAYKIASYHRLRGLLDVQTALAQGQPVLMGFMVSKSFESIKADGLMPLPDPDEEVLGGHACVIVGYDDNAAHLVVRNSWGSSFGDKGYFYMQYSFVTPENVSDLWTCAV